MSAALRPSRVVILDDGYDHYEIETAILAGLPAELVLRPCRGQADAVLAAIADADAVLVRESPINAEALAAAPRLKGIVRYGIGTDNIDRATATSRRIVVANVPDYGTEDVADHALALLMAVARRVVSRDRHVRQGGWFVGTSEKIYRPMGKTLGLVGYGRIARTFERRMRAFGIGRVLVHDPFARTVDAVELVSMENLCAQSDYISLHAPLSEATWHIISAERLALMRPQAILINTARGGLIDEAALIVTLKEGRIFGAGLDVFETEPPRPDNPLLGMSNVVLSDHAAWYSEESVADLQRKAAEEIVRILRGDRPSNWLNPWN